MTTINKTPLSKWSLYCFLVVYGLCWMKDVAYAAVTYPLKVDSHNSVWANVCQRFESYQNETKRR